MFYRGSTYWPVILLTSFVSLSHAFLPSPEALDRGVKFGYAALQQPQILIPLKDHEQCISMIMVDKENAISSCIDITGNRRAWEFIIGELEFMANFDFTSYSDDYSFKPIPKDFPDQIYRNIQQKLPELVYDNNVFPVSMDELNEERIIELKNTYADLQKKQKSLQPMFATAVYIVGDTEQSMIPLDVSVMLTIAKKHQDTKRKNSPCSRYHIHPASQATLGDLYNVFRYLKKLDQDSLKFSLSDIQTRSYDPSFCCIHADDILSCRKEHQGKHMFQAQVISNDGMPKPFILHKTLGASYLDDIISSYNKDLVNAKTASAISNIVADYTRQLLIVHPYDDANGRVFRILANYVLMLYGLAPLAFDHFSPIPFTRTEWREMFKQAQEESIYLLDKQP